MARSSVSQARDAVEPRCLDRTWLPGAAIIWLPMLLNFISWSIQFWADFVDFSRKWPPLVSDHFLAHQAWSLTRELTVSLHTASPSKIWINQSALSRRQKLYCPDVITQTSLSALASQNSFFRRAACSLSLIIYNKGNGEIFIQSEGENGSRHLWC